MKDMKNEMMNENQAWVEQLLEQLEIDHKYDMFHQTYSYKEEPSADVLERWEVNKVKKHLDFVFKQFIAYQENSTKYVFDESYHGYLDSVTDWTVLKDFMNYMTGYIEGVEKDADDPYLLSFRDDDDDF